MLNRIQVFSSNLRSHLQGWYGDPNNWIGSGPGEDPGSRECPVEFCLIYIWYLVSGTKV